MGPAMAARPARSRDALLHAIRTGASLEGLGAEINYDPKLALYNQLTDLKPDEIRTRLEECLTPGHPLYGTPLLVAVETKDEATIKAVLRHGAAFDYDLHMWFANLKSELLVEGAIDALQVVTQFEPRLEASPRTALIAAIQAQHEPTVRLLLDANASPFLFDGMPLVTALLVQNTAIVRLLLERDAGVIGQGPLRPWHLPHAPTLSIDGSPITVGAFVPDEQVPHNAICAAVATGKPELLYLVLAEPRQSLESLAQGLWLACRYGNADMVRYLAPLVDVNHGDSKVRLIDWHATLLPEPLEDAKVLKFEAEESVKFQAGTALYAAVMSGHEAIVEVLLRLKADPDARGTAVSTPLEEACRLGNVEITRRLLKAGAKINARNTSAVGAAVGSGNSTLVEMLLHHGASLRTPYHGKWTLLMIAAARGDKPMFDLLIKLGETTMLKSKHHDLLLKWACKGGDLEILQAVLDVVEKPVSLQKFGRFLCMAAESARLDVLERVWNWGATPGMTMTGTDGSHDRILDEVVPAAFCSGNFDVCKFLLDHGLRLAEPEKLLAWVAKYGDEKTLLLVLEAHHKVVTPSRIADVLDAAANVGKLENVKFILAHSSGPVATETVIEKACSANDEELVATLVARGCARGSALRYAVRATVKQRRKLMCSSLLQNADTELLTYSMIQAARAGWREMVESLLDRGADASDTAVAEGITDEGALESSILSGSVPTLRLILHRRPIPLSGDVLENARRLATNNSRMTMILRKYGDEVIPAQGASKIPSKAIPESVIDHRSSYEILAASQVTQAPVTKRDPQGIPPVINPVLHQGMSKVLRPLVNYDPPLVREYRLQMSNPPVQQIIPLPRPGRHGNPFLRTPQTAQDLSQPSDDPQTEEGSLLSPAAAESSAKASLNADTADPAAATAEQTGPGVTEIAMLPISKINTLLVRHDSSQECTITIAVFRKDAKGSIQRRLRVVRGVGKDSSGNHKPTKDIDTDEKLFEAIRRTYNNELCGLSRRVFSMKSLKQINVLSYTATTRPVRVPYDDFTLQELMYLFRDPSSVEGETLWIDWVFRLKTGDPHRKHILQFEEAWDGGKIAVAGCIPLAGSCIMAVIWTSLGGDAQTVFAVAGFILAAGTALLALVAVVSSVSS